MAAAARRGLPRAGRAHARVPRVLARGHARSTRSPAAPRLAAGSARRGGDAHARRRPRHPVGVLLDAEPVQPARLVRARRRARARRAARACARCTRAGRSSAPLLDNAEMSLLKADMRHRRALLGPGARPGAGRHRLRPPSRAEYARTREAILDVTGHAGADGRRPRHPALGAAPQSLRRPAELSAGRDAPPAARARPIRRGPRPSAAARSSCSPSTASPPACGTRDDAPGARARILLESLGLLILLVPLHFFLHRPDRTAWGTAAALLLFFLPAMLAVARVEAGAGSVAAEALGYLVFGFGLGLLVARAGRDRPGRAARGDRRPLAGPPSSVGRHRRLLGSRHGRGVRVDPVPGLVPAGRRRAAGAARPARPPAPGAR